MRKTLSMILVLCLIITTLIGSNVMSVDAAFTKANNVITYTFDANETKGFDVGDWELSNGNGSTVTLGTTSDTTKNANMTFKKIQFAEGNLTDIAADAASLQLRTEISGSGKSKYLSADTNYTTDDLGQQKVKVSTMNSETAGTPDHLATEKVFVYTMYAYSKKSTGEPLVVNMTAGAADDTTFATTISAVDLYSKDGVPHKIDIVLFRASSTAIISNTGWYRYHIYIDGLFYKKIKGKSGKIATTSHQFAPTLSIKLSPANGSLSWSDTEWYVWTPPIDDPVSYANYATKGVVDGHSVIDYIFESNIGWEDSDLAGNVKTDVVDGIDSKIDELLNGVLLTVYTI